MPPVSDAPTAFRPRRTASPAQRPQTRVALFTGAYNHIADGVSLTLNRLVAHLEASGFDVRVFAPTVDEPPVDHEGTLVPVPSMAAPGRSEYRVALTLTGDAKAALNDFEPDLVHIATPDLLGVSARQWALDAGVPLVATYHTHFSSYLKYYHMGLLEKPLWAYLRWFYAPFRHVYVPTRSMEDVLRAEGITGGLRRWARGVDTGRFRPEQRSVDWRRAQGIADDEVVVAYVSRLVWEKAPDVFAEVVEGLAERGIPHRSLIVGDGPARADLEERLPATIFTGRLDGAALPRAYASSDVFLFPSASETFGNVTLEAMACGLPTVCADATGSRTLVEDGTTGFLAPPDDAETFLDKTARLVTDAALRKQMGTAAHERAMEFDWPIILDQMTGYYREVLAGEPASLAKVGR